MFVTCLHCASVHMSHSLSSYAKHIAALSVTYVLQWTIFYQILCVIRWSLSFDQACTLNLLSCSSTRLSTQWSVHF